MIFQVMADQLTDELAPYFTRDTQPKLLITSSDKICSRSRVSISLHSCSQCSPFECLQGFCKQLAETIPNSQFFSRHDQDLKKIIARGIEAGYTDLLVINEDRKTPNGLIMSRLPNGPTLHFKMTNVKLRVSRVYNWTSRLFYLHEFILLIITGVCTSIWSLVIYGSLFILLPQL